MENKDITKLTNEERAKLGYSSIAGDFNTATGERISLNTLKSNETPIVTPPPTTPTTITEPTLPKSELDTEVERLKTEKQTQESGISSIVKQLGIEEGKKADYITQEGGDKALKEYKRFESDLDAEKLALRRQQETVRKTFGGTTAGLQNELGRIERDSLSKQADIAILGNAAKGQYDAAVDIAKTKVESAVAPLKADLDAKKFIYENNKDLFSKAEGSTLERLFAEEERKIKKEEEDLTKANEMVINALQGKAPQSLVSKAQEILNKGGSSNDVAKVLGSYGMSISDRLDNQLKSAQINKIQAELLPTPDAGELVKVNGKDMIRYKDGTFSEPILPEAGDTATVTSRLNEKINTVEGLINNKAALSYSAGAFRLNPPPGFINTVNDWKANMGNILDKLTVDELGRVKTDGVTFGQLSNGERLAVGNAASALNKANITKGSGDDKVTTGRFKMSEKEVQRQLGIILDAYKLDFERRVGVPFEQYKANPEIVKNKAADDFIDESGMFIQVNSNYGDYPTN